MFMWQYLRRVYETVDAMNVRWIFIAVVFLFGCEAEQAQTTGPETTPDEPITKEPVSDLSAPLSELHTLDPRRPVPLQPMMAWHQKQNMMDHLVAIQQITDGLARDDWDAVIEANKRIETSPQMQQMCQHMGMGAEGFTELALEFHRRADVIGVAAKKKDKTAALAAMSKTLESCTGCHATYRQDVVDATTWEKRTGSAHDPSTMPTH
jgi:hypothetical protein